MSLDAITINDLLPILRSHVEKYGDLAIYVRVSYYGGPDGYPSQRTGRLVEARVPDFDGKALLLEGPEIDWLG